MTAQHAPSRSSPRRPLRRDVPGAVVLFGWLGVVFTLLIAMCLGMVVAGSAAQMRQITAAARAEREEIEARRLERTKGYEVLDRLRLRLEGRFSVERMFPESLGHLPPQDVWGNPLRYTREHPRRAELRSAGPDGAFDTPDDLVRTLGSE